MRNGMVLGVIALLVWGAVGAASSPIADVDAVRRLVETEILPTYHADGDYIAFLLSRSVGPNDVLSPYAPTPIPDDVDRLPHLTPYGIASSCWFVWVDLVPGARYAHETLFVLIDTETLAYTVSREMWWPVLNGRSLWTTPDTYWDSQTWLTASTASSAPTSTSGIPCEEERPGSDYFDWALVVNGWAPGEPGEEGFAADVNSMCGALSDLGMRVSVLPVGAAGPEAIESFMERLFTERPLYSCCDRLYIYIASHASPGSLWIGGQRLSSSELARMMAFPGQTYVPSRVYVLLETGYGASFITDLSGQGNVFRVWTASGLDEPSWSDVDTPDDPNPEDAGGEWTSSFLEALAAILSEDPLGGQAAEFGREYMSLNMAYGRSSAANASVLEGQSTPSAYRRVGAESLLESIRYVARWARLYHIQAGTLDEVIAKHAVSPCIAFLWFLHFTARHDALPVPPSSGLNAREAKQHAKDVANSDWWLYCDLFWEVLTTPDDEQ